MWIVRVLCGPSVTPIAPFQCFCSVFSYQYVTLPKVLGNSSDIFLQAVGSNTCLIFFNYLSPAAARDNRLFSIATESVWFLFYCIFGLCLEARIEHFDLVTLFLSVALLWSFPHSTFLNFLSSAFSFYNRRHVVPTNLVFSGCIISRDHRRRLLISHRTPCTADLSIIISPRLIFFLFPETLLSVLAGTLNFKHSKSM